MAYGIEIVLGYRLEEWDKFQAKKPDIAGDMELYDALNDFDRTWFVEDHQLLSQVFTNCCQRLGFTYVSTRTPYPYSEYQVWQTPLGNREFGSLEFELFFDPHEMGDQPEDAVLGVAITGRYKPTLLDWRGERGMINNSYLDLEELAVVREEMAKLIPWMADAKVIPILKHY